MAKFASTHCSQCGGEFGPGDHGYSHCDDHRRGASVGGAKGGGMMEDETTAVTVVETHAIESWTGAAARGLEARREREQIIKSVLRKDSDFGVIPGAGGKPTLLKPGAEKIADSLNLWPDYEIIDATRDWKEPFFNFDIRCTLRNRGGNLPMATGLGSCNSMEAKYRWRETQRSCPKCGAAAIIKGKAEYGGGWLCFKKKGGCGAKWPDGATEIESQSTERVPNDDIYSQVNTVEKMACKRALVAATLNLGFSDHFTQDMEDLRPASPSAEPEPPSHDPVWDDPMAPVPEPEMDFSPVEHLPLKAAPAEAALSATKRELEAELEAWPADKRDAVIQQCSMIRGDDGEPALKDGRPIAVESLAKMLLPRISDRWAGATLGKIRAMKARLAAEKGVA